MTITNGHHTTDPPTVIGAARPVTLLRYRPGITGEATRLVHLVPLPPGSETPATGVALCGTLLRADLVETVTPGHGMPCSLCVTSHTSANPRPVPTLTPATKNATTEDTGSQAAAATYRAWGWPVTHHRHQVWLTLEPTTVALIIPAPLSTDLTTILSQLRCSPLVLAHPDTPQHHILLAGQRLDVAPPWSPGVQRTTGAFPLPPTMTPHGPLTWVYPPDADALRRCREREVFAALRTVLRDPPP